MPAAVAADPAIRDFPLPTAGAKPPEIVTATDGALWFAERGTNRLGRITTTGAIDEIPLRLHELDSDVRHTHRTQEPAGQTPSLTGF